MVFHRLFIMVMNIIFPPVAVMLLTGLGWDTFLSCTLFLLAIIPSHIHGFYISCTYFNRKRKVRKGRWPGGPKWCIDSEDVLCGGASREELKQLKRMESKRRRGSVRRSRDSVRISNATMMENGEMWNPPRP